MSLTRILLVDDHQLFREGLVSILNSQPDFEVIGEAGDGLEAQVKARILKPDLILMDISMPGFDGLEATKLIKHEQPDVMIVMLTVRDEDEQLFKSIRSGAQGYLLKNIRSKEMLELLRGAVHGEAAITPSLSGRILDEFRRLSTLAKDSPGERIETLTSREQEILRYVAAGSSNIEIANKLNISVHTVKTHIRKILAKLHQVRRYEAASYAKSSGLIPSSNDK